MHKLKSQTAPKIFENKFRKPIHKYPTNFVSINTEFNQIMEEHSYKL